MNAITTKISFLFDMVLHNDKRNKQDPNMVEQAPATWDAKNHYCFSCCGILETYYFIQHYSNTHTMRVANQTRELIRSIRWWWASDESSQKEKKKWRFSSHQCMRVGETSLTSLNGGSCKSQKKGHIGQMLIIIRCPSSSLNRAHKRLNIEHYTLDKRNSKR